MISDVTIVVGTFDLYKAAWPPMCHGLTKYWPDCPWPVVFITDRADPPLFTAIKAGKPPDWAEKHSWSRRIIYGLQRIKSPVVLWLTEDNWLTASPDTAAIKDFARYIAERRADHIRLYPGWDHDEAAGACPYDPRLAIFEKKASYRCSLKPGLWRRKTFLELLRDGESAWDFERQGSRRSRHYGNRFMAVRKWGYFSFVTAGDPSGDWVKSPVVKGRWTKAAKKYAQQEGLKIDFSKHPMNRIIDDKLRKVDWVLP